VCAKHAHRKPFRSRAPDELTNLVDRIRA